MDKNKMCLLPHHCNCHCWCCCYCCCLLSWNVCSYHHRQTSLCEVVWRLSHQHCGHYLHQNCCCLESVRDNAFSIGVCHSYRRPCQPHFGHCVVSVVLVHPKGIWQLFRNSKYGVISKKYKLIHKKKISELDECFVFIPFFVLNVMCSW